MLKKEVLRDKRNFSAVYNKGKSFGSKHVVLFCKKNSEKYNRLGFLASKKVGNSVTRNRARRLMKESYRNIQSELNEGYDLIFIARKGIEKEKCQTVQKSMIFLLKKADILKRG